MQKLNCIICDSCRIVCTKDHITIKGKKRLLHYCPKCIVQRERLNEEEARDLEAKMGF